MKKKPTRPRKRLSLSRDTVRSLTPSSLRRIGGGATDSCNAQQQQQQQAPGVSLTSCLTC